MLSGVWKSGVLLILYMFSRMLRFSFYVLQCEKFSALKKEHHSNTIIISHLFLYTGADSTLD